MNSIQKTFILILTIVSFSFFACQNSHNSNSHQEETVNTSGKEYTSKYVCPMHCEGSGSEEPGTCPVCEMDYVLNENATTHEGHEH